MRRGRNLGTRIGGALVVLIGALSAGCQQPMPYYVVCPQPGTVSTLPAGTVVTTDPGTTVAYGDVCSVGTGTVVQAGAPMLTQAAPGSGPIIVGNAPTTTASPLLVQPTRPGLFSGWRGWRASEPAPRLSIRAEGAYDDGQVVR
jgi:hypothetical protein